jgi:hypothetical protein
VNELKVSHAPKACNRARSLREGPLKSAQLHNFALRLDLRRARGELVGSHKTAAVNRLLDVNAAVSRSLAWLRGDLNGMDDIAEEFAQLAIELGATSDAVGVPQ